MAELKIAIIGGQRSGKAELMRILEKEEGYERFNRLFYNETIYLHCPPWYNSRNQLLKIFGFNQAYTLARIMELRRIIERPDA